MALEMTAFLTYEGAKSSDTPEHYCDNYLISFDLLRTDAADFMRRVPGDLNDHSELWIAILSEGYRWVAFADGMCREQSLYKGWGPPRRLFEEGRIGSRTASRYEAVLYSQVYFQDRAERGDAAMQEPPWSEVPPPEPDLPVIPPMRWPRRASRGETPPPEPAPPIRQILVQLITYRSTLGLSGSEYEVDRVMEVDLLTGDVQAFIRGIPPGLDEYSLLAVAITRADGEVQSYVDGMLLGPPAETGPTTRGSLKRIGQTSEMFAEIRRHSLEIYAKKWTRNRASDAAPEIQGPLDSCMWLLDPPWP